MAWEPVIGDFPLQCAGCFSDVFLPFLCTTVAVTRCLIILHFCSYALGGVGCCLARVNFSHYLVLHLYPAFRLTHAISISSLKWYLVAASSNSTEESFFSWGIFSRAGPGQKSATCSWELRKFLQLLLYAALCSLALWPVNFRLLAFGDLQPYILKLGKTQDLSSRIFWGTTFRVRFEEATCLVHATQFPT